MSAEIIRILKVLRCCGLFPRTFESGVGPNERHKVTRIGPASITLIGMSIILLIVRIMLSIISLQETVLREKLHGVASISLEAWNILFFVFYYLYYTSIMLNNKKIVKSLRSLLAISAYLGMPNKVSSLDCQQTLCVLILMLWIIQFMMYALRSIFKLMDYISFILTISTSISFLFLITFYYKNVALIYKRIISKSGEFFFERKKNYESLPKLLKVPKKSKNDPGQQENHHSAMNSNHPFNEDSNSEILLDRSKDCLLLNVLMTLKALDDCISLFTDAVSFAIIADLTISACGMTGALYFSLRELPKMVIDRMLLSTASLLILIFYVNVGTQINYQVNIYLKCSHY